MPAPHARSIVQRVVLALIVAAPLVAAPAAHAATPETITLTPASLPATWQTPLLVGANALDRTTCVENTSCDTVRIVLAAGDWRGKQVTVSIDWLVPASDWDLYLFRDHLDGSAAGQSNSPPPGTHESIPIVINAILAAPRVYVAHVVGSAASPEMVHGTASVQAAPVARTATHLFDSTIHYSANMTVLAPVSSRDCEPSIRVDTRGNAYVGGIRGVPAGVDLWRFDLDPTSAGFDPELRHPVYLGQPDAFAPGDTTGGRDGGGDIDIATSFPSSPSVTPEVTIVSLAAADISSAISSDRGEHFQLSPVVAAVPADDRQWIEAAGADTVYMMYRAPIPGTSLFLARSTDHGVTYPVSSLVSATGTTPGYLDVDHHTGEIYVCHVSDAAVMVSHSADQGLTWRTTTADNSTAHGHLFDAVKVDDAGTVYVVWSDDHAIWLTHSLDHGLTWAAPVQVSGGESHIALFPWLEAGSAGRVAVVWFSTTSDVNSNATDWRCWSAITLDATASQPVFHMAEVSDHIVHASNISEGGLTVPVVVAGANRNLCDYFQVAIDPQGACVVAYADDHNDFDGHTYVSRQLSGPSLYASANGGTGVLDPVTPTTPPAPDPSMPQVSDFLHDASAGSGLQPIPNDSPYDILSIRYNCATLGLAPLLEARMRVSQLSPVPANSFWRVHFAANVPGLVADRGDQFFLVASTGADPTTPTYSFGSALRDSSGAFVYTTLGPATYGAMDTTTNEVVLRVSLSALDPYIHHGPLVRPGSTLAGLRGSTGTSSASAARDITRGGGSFTLCTENLDAPPLTTAEFGMSAPMPNPVRDGASVYLSLTRAAWTEVGVFDTQGRRVRTVFAGVLPAGSSRVRWDGRTDAGPRAESGVYFMRMLASGQMRSQRMVMLK